MIEIIFIFLTLSYIYGNDSFLDKTISVTRGTYSYNFVVVVAVLKFFFVFLFALRKMSVATAQQ
jgi:hypothetical protein